MPKEPPVSVINPPSVDQEVINSRYYSFTDCCTGTVTYFALPNLTYDGPMDEGVYTYLGGGAVGLQLGYEPISDTYIPLKENNCYDIRVILTGYTPISTGAEYALLYPAPVDIPANYTQIADGDFNCESPSVIADCPECIETCYIAITCDGITYTTSNDLSAYIGTSVTITFPDNPELDPTCAQIGLAPNGYNCAQSFNIAVDTETPCECDCICYSVTGAAEAILYVDCTGNIIQETLTSGVYGPFCSRTVPALTYSDIQNPPIVADNGECVDLDLDGDFQCVVNCYELIDCNGVEDDIITNSDLYFHYVSNNVVKIAGSDTCWNISIAESCDCAVAVSVLQYYSSCETCQDPINYRLTECTTKEIVYSSSDLSQYVDQVIVRENCSGCWLVEQLDTNIPSDIIITVSSSFEDCILCNTTYYQLTDCEDEENVLYTSDDLSQYVNGVITLEWCPETCWSVSLTETPGATTLVIPDINYQSCEACIRAKTSICIRVQNISDTPVSFQYYSTDDERETLVVAGLSFSEKICISSYTPNPNLVIKEYGDCVNNNCPVEVLPKYTVKPGYDSKTCSNEYYDSITCSYSERIYKEVLQKRYGISSCCDELIDTYKLWIKKEILELDIINDPDYECNTSSTCGCTPTITYNTNCNS